MDYTKTVPRKLHSHCHFCINNANRERRGKPETLIQRKSRQASGRAHERRRRRRQGITERGPYKLVDGKRGSVRREPFGRWLKERIDSGMTYKELSLAIDVPERHLRTYVLGFDSNGKNIGYNQKGRNVKGRKLRSVDWLRFETVDQAFTAWGEPWLLEELYPLSDDIGDDS